MPTYEYKCETCGYVFERFQSMSDKPASTCPECHGNLHRLISGGAGVIFRGPDYAKNKAPACGRDKPCCGRETPCDHKPCE